MSARRIIEIATEFASRALVLLAVTVMLVLLAFAIFYKPTCPAGLNGTVSLPWLHEMQSQMCGDGK